MTITYKPTNTIAPYWETETIENRVFAIFVIPGGCIPDYKMVQGLERAAHKAIKGVLVARGRKTSDRLSINLMDSHEMHAGVPCTRIEFAQCGYVGSN
jgi:hypothetical protein